MLGWGVGVVLGVGSGSGVVIAMGFVHAFMKGLGRAPGVLVAGSGTEDEGGGGNEGEDDFHGGVCGEFRGGWVACNRLLKMKGEAWLGMGLWA